MERKFRMAWKVEADRKTNYLAGTAHFFPYSFKKSLTELIDKTETVLLEGPLDESNMDLVRQYGLEEKESRSLLEVLDHSTLEKIILEFEGKATLADSSFLAYMDIFRPGKGAALHHEIEGLKPWMAFFKTWTHYLRKRGWKYSVDMEAYEAAKQLNKNVYFLESIEEQIHALEGIPLERIAAFFKKIDLWEKYAKRHSKHYLAGKYDSMLTVISEFPTRCESIIDNRDPILFERMKPHMEKGNAIALVGTSHVAGIIKMLEGSGFAVSKLER